MCLFNCRFSESRRRPTSCGLLCLAFLALCASSLHAQWRTQSISLEPGWNGVFLHVDAAHEDLATMVASDASNPISTIWQWTTPATYQFVDNPATAETRTGWTKWQRGDPASPLARLVGDTAYLVFTTNSYTWQVKGTPLPPRSAWNVEGLNLIGFPTPPTTAPTIESFLLNATGLENENLTFLQYAGLELGDNNPAQIPAFLHRSVRLTRGKAFWLRADEAATGYLGPFQVDLQGRRQLDFYDDLRTLRFRLRNRTAAGIVLTMEHVPSEAAPSGQAALAGAPPLLVRGALNAQEQTYAFAELPPNPGSGQLFILPPAGEEGSDVEVVIGLDRSAITAPAGSLLGSMLRFTDQTGRLQIDVPVRAEATSDTGLWVGEAQVTQVGQYRKTYADGALAPIITTNGSTIVTNDRVVATDGSYVVTNLITDIGDVQKMFPLRLIVHNPDGSASAQLLQRVYYGLDPGSNAVLSVTQSVLDPERLDSARRISATHLPWRPGNETWSFDRNLAAGGWMSTTIVAPFNDQQSNPFLHTYHPDHDNLDERFRNEVSRGSESYTIERDIQLSISPPANDFISRVSTDQRLLGDYRETIRIIGLARAGGSADTKTFETRGVFRLDRLSTIPTLTTP